MVVYSNLTSAQEKGRDGARMKTGLRDVFEGGGGKEVMGELQDEKNGVMERKGGGGEERGDARGRRARMWDERVRRRRR